MLGLLTLVFDFYQSESRFPHGIDHHLVQSNGVTRLGSPSMAGAEQNLGPNSLPSVVLFLISVLSALRVPDSLPQGPGSEDSGIQYKNHFLCAH